MKKVAWFTPFHKYSAIGQKSAHICEELQKRYNVRIFSPSKENIIDTSLNVTVFDKSFDSTSLVKYDYVIYNMGNFAGNHRAIYDVAADFPGIMLLHDQTMSGFFYQYFLMDEFGGDSKHGLPDYKNFISFYYGDDAVAEAEKAILKNRIPDFRLLEPVLRNARGVFTHAGFFLQELGRYTNIISEYAYLPCGDGRLAPDRHGIIRNYYDRDDMKLQIVSSGMVHHSKRVDKIINVLLENRDIASMVQYVTVGDYGGEYGERLKSISENELRGCFYMLGYQSDDVMKSAIVNSDICVNLRYPNNEVCSLSLFEQMEQSKPCIVLSGGVFGELPEECVIRIDLKNEATGIETVLRNCLGNRHFYDGVGERAGEFIKNNCTYTAYAEKISRLMDRLDVEEYVPRMTDGAVDAIRGAFSSLGFSEECCPNTIEDLVDKVSFLTGRAETAVYSKRVVGIWMGFQYHVPGIRREGIVRFASYLSEALMRYHNVDIEVWGYDINYSEMRESFEQIFADPALCCRISIVTEKNWRDFFDTFDYDKIFFDEISSEKDNLSALARYVSKACCFVPVILYLDNVLGVDKPVFVPAHDMATHKYYGDFIKRAPGYKSISADIEWRANRLAVSGAVMFSNTRYVLEDQIIKYIRNLNRKNTRQIYIPMNDVSGLESSLLSEQAVRERFNIKGTYLFYATQIRPYKNVSLIIHALAELKNDFTDLKLVLTGNPGDYPEVDCLIDKYRLRNKVRVLKDLTTTELYSVYKYAAAVPVPSVFEGGIPWQACEAMAFDVPVALAGIPVSIERIESFGLTKDNCGVTIFDPSSVSSLKDALIYLLKNRDKAVCDQKLLKDKLETYTWREAANLYYAMLFGEDR